jgi:hypothetical protein
LVREGKIAQKEGQKFCDNPGFFNELMIKGI